MQLSQNTKQQKLIKQTPMNKQTWLETMKQELVQNA